MSLFTWYFAKSEAKTVENHQLYEKEKKRVNFRMHLIVDICVALEKNTMFSAQSLNEKKYLWIYQQMNLVDFETTEVLKDTYMCPRYA